MQQPRDWKHMHNTLDSVLVIWTQFPHLRLGQLIENAVGRANGADVFNVEDEVLLRDLVKLKDELCGKS